MFAYNIGGSRPIIGVDGAHLRGPYSGILLTVVELLRNDIISVADSVTWIHEQDEFTYMSDRQNYFKGLIDAFRRVMHSADTRYCCRHFWTNFKAKLFSEIYKEQFWKARSSTKVFILILFSFFHWLHKVQMFNIHVFITCHNTISRLQWIRSRLLMKMPSNTCKTYQFVTGPCAWF
ncbi:uncharacterized protein LOC125493342 isoform X3 [Beta vulgaris subsp. vulgaris]|uniref:uncharacterized protein LOC125493342 isoform X3 n=1 Tax=Beta vulgaris subsp. vulgaris TaxID=3555 RepID=UPI00254991C1|nr:uncharacterized protein LOC125493342 isoform X3 [Beta vulgaris subsp. vulgaris]